MKTTWSVFLVLCLLTAVEPGSRGQEKAQDKVEEFNTPFFPLQVGSERRYRVGDHEVVVRVTKQDVFEWKPDPAKTATVKAKGFHLASSSDNRTLSEQVLVLQDGVYRIGSAGKDISPPLCFLKLPPKKGDTWQVDSRSDDMILKGTFSCDEEEITILSRQNKKNTVKTFKVSCKDFQIGADRISVTYWFAEKVGLVKQRTQVGNSDILMELMVP